MKDFRPLRRQRAQTREGNLSRSCAQAPDAVGAGASASQFAMQAQLRLSHGHNRKRHRRGALYPAMFP